jgi:hypothetical protein
MISARRGMKCEEVVLLRIEQENDPIEKPVLVHGFKN